MNGPDIVAVESLRGHLAQRLPTLGQGPGVRHFAVVRSGTTVQGKFEADEVIVCADAVSDGDTVVLVPRGWGNPQVGTMRGQRIVGEAGEPCHPGRWQVAGRIVAVWRRRMGAWVCELNEFVEAEGSQASVQASPPHLIKAQTAPIPGQQLALFAA